ncbi:MAG TPA: TolC family protein [Cytophagaceae bacterium]|nr:TolC family protein [Cytophagaceae bacterium]
MKKTNAFFMKRGILTAMAVVLTFGLSRAQTDSSYTLQQCIDYALKNSTNIQNAELDAAIARARMGEVRSAGLPQITSQAQLVDNPTLQRMFLKNGAFYTDPTQPIGSTIAVRNLFQQRSSGDINASASQLIFNGSYFVGLKAAKAYSELADKNTEFSKVEIVSNVTKAFYLVTITKERIAILNANISRVDTLLRQTSSMQQKGFVEVIDVSRLEVTYNNLLTEREKFLNLIVISELLLKFQMGYDVNKNITLTGTIEDLKKAETATLGAKVDYNNRVEYQLLNSQRKLENYNLKNIRAGYLPTISAFGKIGTIRMDQNIGAVLSNKWYSYNMWGLTANLSIFDGFNKRYKAQQSKIAIRKIENSIQNFEETADLQVQQSEITLKNNMKSLEIQKKNVDLAKEVSNVSKIKYQQGVGSNLEVVTAESSYKEAQTNYYNALYDLIIAQVDYQKALGTLYNAQ